MTVRSRPRPEPRPRAELPDRYASVRLLAHGGMGSVWCAEDKVLGRRVAIKLLGEGFMDDAHAVRRFMREARAAGRLSGHPHVVTIFDVGEWDGRPYIVMEHLAGGTVGDAIRLGAFSRHEALRWIEEAASALDYAHGQGVVHRDVKPANLLLGCDRGLRIADFGIASLGTEPTMSGQLFGTAAYLSPEQARGESATSASDRYALAVTAFELLTGTRPFNGTTFAAQARAHLEDPPPRASDREPVLGPAVDAALQRGMAKQPQKRWRTARSFARRLRTALEAGELTRIPAATLPTPPAEAPARIPVPPSVVFDEPVHRGDQRTRRRLTAALGVLAAAALGSGVIAGSGALSASHPALSIVKSAPGSTKVAPTATRHHPRHPRTTTATTAASTTGQLTPGELEAQGHQLMADGEYRQALPLLREAVSTAGHQTLTYAYALYDLGRTLRLDGDPGAAIPILEERLQIPNQPGVVRAELALAEREAGAQTASDTADASGGASPAPAASPPGSDTQVPPGHLPGGPHGLPSGGAGLAAPGPGRGHAYGHQDGQLERLGAGLMPVPEA